MCVNNTLMECSSYLIKESEAIKMTKENLLARAKSSKNAKNVFSKIK